MKRGSSTAVGSNVGYRLGKLQARGLLHGEWLDCGCADGGYTVALVEHGVERAVGIDVEQGRVRSALERTRGSSHTAFCCSTSENLPFRDGSFDGVLLNEVLEHVADEGATLREILRVLRPGGYLALMSPNRWFPFEGHGMRIRGKSVPFPVPLLPWLPSKFAMQFMEARNYWPGELRTIVRRAGFEISSSSTLLPVFEVYRWLPAPVIRGYRRMVPVIEASPGIRQLGVSNLIIARRPS